MSLFDWVRCDFPLPDDPAPGLRSFQSKDGECYMEEYTITADGRLLHRFPTRYEDQSDPNAEGMMAMFGSMTPVDFREEHELFTGQFDILDRDDGREYRLIFVNGSVTHVEKLWEAQP